MMAAHMASILPPPERVEALETSMIQSVAGLLGSDGIQSTHPFCEPRHTATMAAIVGGAKAQNRGKFHWRTKAFYFWMNNPSFHAMF